MSKTSTRIYSDIAFQKGMPFAQASVRVAAGQLHVVRVKAPSEGRLTHLSVNQDDSEPQVVFEIETLKSIIPWPLADQDMPAATPPADDVSIYRIISKQVGAAGFPIEVTDEATGYAYRNMDGNNTNNQRYIYIILAPGGFGVGAGAPTTWKIRVTVVSDVG